MIWQTSTNDQSLKLKIKINGIEIEVLAETRTDAAIISPNHGIQIGLFQR